MTNHKETCNVCGKELSEEHSQDGTCEGCLLTQIQPRPAVQATDAPEMPSLTEVEAALPRFTILGIAGRGGSAMVYLAVDKDLDRQVAIKVIPTADEAPEETLRVKREFTLMAKLRHGNIVVLHDIGRTDGFTYLIMEWMRGGSITNLLQLGKFSIERSIEVVTQICSVLRYTHSRSIFHRDIKPSNILLDRKGNAKLADFGLANGTSRLPHDTTITGSHQFLGTPQYAAPEQCKAGAAVDGRADLYSLGIVFFEMVTGSRPERLLQLPSRYSSELEPIDSVVAKALATDPEARFQSAEEFATSLEDVLK